MTDAARRGSPRISCIEVIGRRIGRVAVVCDEPDEHGVLIGDSSLRDRGLQRAQPPQNAHNGSATPRSLLARRVPNGSRRDFPIPESMRIASKTAVVVLEPLLAGVPVVASAARGMSLKFAAMATNGRRFFSFPHALRLVGAATEDWPIPTHAGLHSTGAL